MSEARETRRALKDACFAILNSAAVEHPAGHQSKLAARYIIVSRSGERIGLMFEKHESVPAQVWIAHRFAKGLVDGDILVREYKAEELYRSLEADAEPTYGRHAALKAMRDLANADLLRFTVASRDQLEEITLHLAKL